MIAVEPHPEARDGLAALAARNGVTGRIDVVPVALSDAKGTAQLHLDDEFTSYATLDPWASPMRGSATFGRSIQVETTTLDRWIAGRDDLVSRIRCIKIDVEGAEARVLAGMTDALARYNGPIICETSVGSAADTMLLAAGFTRHSIEKGAYGNHLYIRS